MFYSFHVILISLLFNCNTISVIQPLTGCPWSQYTSYPLKFFPILKWKFGNGSRSERTTSIQILERHAPEGGGGFLQTATRLLWYFIPKKTKRTSVARVAGCYFHLFQNSEKLTESICRWMYFKPRIWSFFGTRKNHLRRAFQNSQYLKKWQ